MNQNTLASGQQQIPMAEQQPPKRARPTDPKGMLEWDIEQERMKIQQMEARYRQELEKLRKDHQRGVEELEKKHHQQKGQHEGEKQTLETDKNNAMEQEKKQLT